MNNKLRFLLLFCLVSMNCLAQNTDLSGFWGDDVTPGAVYRVRQVGNKFYWLVDGTSQKSFANVFIGEISGNTITGGWLDLPGSSVYSSGNMILRIESNDRIVKVSANNAYGAQEWRRRGTSGSGGGGGAAGGVTAPGGNSAACTGDKIDWNYDFRNAPNRIGQRANLCCAGNPVIPNNVCGTDIYADSSAVCTSALHAGLITQAGGPVTLEFVNGLSEYRTIARNGVPAAYCNGRGQSYRFIGAGSASGVSGGAGGSSGGASGGAQGRNIAWNYAPGSDHRGANGQRFTLTCPANGALSRIWGTDSYTDDSPVCSAAVHSGLITAASGGTVVIEIRPSQQQYQGSARNGVTSLDFTYFPGSYGFVTAAR